MKNKISSSRNKGKEVNYVSDNQSRVTHILLLPLASILYTYGVICITATITIFIVFAIRRDVQIFQEASLEHTLTLIVGLIIFLPARAFRNHLLKS
jgi:hypothetical protein